MSKNESGGISRRLGVPRPCMMPMCLAAALLLGGCSAVPTSGPSLFRVLDAPQVVGTSPIQVVPLTDKVAKHLLDQRDRRLFSTSLAAARPSRSLLDVGDTVEITIWEAPPATLFASGGVLGALARPREGAGTGITGAVTLPEQVIASDGHISVPFAGEVMAMGRTTKQIQDEIAAKIQDRANKPQVLARALRNSSSAVTVVGDVATSMRMPLGSRSERLLDAVAAAGGSKNPVNKVTVQITRGGTVMSLPLETVIQNPNENVSLQSGDVVTLLFQPLSFTALGATGKNEEINFEASGISLAQALARAGGLQDSRSDPRGVFIFRYERPAAMTSVSPLVPTTPDGLVPVIYLVDLKDPGSFFAAQAFDIKNKDVLYVSNAPLAELQKFANVIYSIAFPIITLTR